LRGIDGFQECPKLHRIAVPGTAEVIGVRVFRDFVSLREFAFNGEQAKRQICGFVGCVADSLHFECSFANQAQS
jgi:hypothetical protein